MIPDWAERCFVIGDSSRREILSIDSLINFGFQPQIIAPFFFKEWPEFFSRERSLAFNRRSLGLGELGCARSHLECYSNFLNTNGKFALIFEDDAFITEDNFSDFIMALNEICLVEPNLDEGGRVYSFYSESFLIGRQDLEIGRFLKVFGEPSHAVCYVVNRLGAKILAAENRNLDFQADWPRSTEMSYFLYSKKLVSHGSDLSSRHSFLESERFRQVHSPLKRFLLAIKSILFITYFLKRKYYVSKTEYFSRNVFPIIRWTILRVFSSRLENWPRGARMTLW